MAKRQGKPVTLGVRSGEAPKPDLVTLKVTLTREVARQLRLEAFGRDVSLGTVVADLVRAAPRRFVLQDRGRGAVGADGPAGLVVAAGGGGVGADGPAGLAVA